MILVIIMFFILFSFFSFKLWAQTESLSQGFPQRFSLEAAGAGTSNSDDSQCISELNLNEVELAFNNLNPELRELFLELARLRESLDKTREDAELRSKIYINRLNELKALVLKQNEKASFDLLLGFARHLARVEKDKVESKRTQQQEISEKTAQVVNGVMRLELAVNALRNDGRTIKDLYPGSSALFVEHRQVDYFKTDLGVKFLDEAYGLAYSIQLKELITKIVQAEDISHKKALALLKEIKPKFKHGEAQQILEFEALLQGTSLETWAKDAMPRLFIDMNRAPTRLGQKMRAILWPESNSGNQNPNPNPELREFVIRAIQDPMSDSFWTTASLVRAFRGILNMGQTPEAVRAWLSKPARDPRAARAAGTPRIETIQAKARYLGLMLNQFDYNNWITLIPASELIEVEKAIDEFSILRLIRKGLQETQKTLTDFSGLALEAFEFVKAPIPKGGITYTMGSPPNEWGREDYELQTETTLKQAFQFGTTKITQWLFKIIMGNAKKAYFNKGQLSFNYGMDSISAMDSEAFAKALTDFLKKIDPNHPCRYELPTEARWEWMARGGTQTLYSFGNDVDDLEDYAYFITNSQFQTLPVTDKLPNGFGIYGVHGDLREWMQDAFLRILPGGVDPVVPHTHTLNVHRVLRNGGRLENASKQRSAYRGQFLTFFSSSELDGARLVRICE